MSKGLHDMSQWGNHLIYISHSSAEHESAAWYHADSLNMSHDFMTEDCGKFVRNITKYIFLFCQDCVNLSLIS